MRQSTKKRRYYAVLAHVRTHGYVEASTGIDISELPDAQIVHIARANRRNHFSEDQLAANTRNNEYDGITTRRRSDGSRHKFIEATREYTRARYLYFRTYNEY